MFLQPGDIIIVKHIVFKDNNIIDTNLHGHPALILYTTPEFIYFLTLTSKTTKRIKQNPYQFYFLNSKEIYFKKDSYINLKNIYKTSTVSYTAQECIPADVLYDILKCFQYYQEHLKKDPLYAEIKDEAQEITRKLKRF